MCNGEHTTGRRFDPRSCQTKNYSLYLLFRSLAHSIWNWE